MLTKGVGGTLLHGLSHGCDDSSIECERRYADPAIDFPRPISLSQSVWQVVC